MAAYLLANAQALMVILISTGVGPGEGIYFDRDSQVLVQSPRFQRAFVQYVYQSTHAQLLHPEPEMADAR